MWFCCYGAGFLQPLSSLALVSLITGYCWWCWWDLGQPLLKHKNPHKHQEILVWKRCRLVELWIPFFSKNHPPWKAVNSSDHNLLLQQFEAPVADHQIWIWLEDRGEIVADRESDGCGMCCERPTFCLCFGFTLLNSQKTAEDRLVVPHWFLVPVYWIIVGWGISLIHCLHRRLWHCGFFCCLQIRKQCRLIRVYIHSMET